MAYTLEQIRNTQTSLYGRRLGIDTNDYLGGPKGMKLQIQDLTTLPGTAQNYGYTNVVASGSSVTNSYTMESPQPGVETVLMLQSTSTGGQQFSFKNGAIVIGASLTTLGSTMIQLLAQNAMARLLGLSTGVYRLLNMDTSLVSSDSMGLSFTTST
jgi:hypothetical protein